MNKKLTLLVVLVMVCSITAFAGGGKDKSAPSIASFADVAWVSETLIETNMTMSGEVTGPSTFSIWINDSGVPIVQAGWIHWHSSPEAEIRGNTLVITMPGQADNGGDPGRVDNAVFRIVGDTLVRTVDGVDHVYTKKQDAAE